MTEVQETKYRLDCADERLWQGDQPVPIRNTAFQLLRYLASNPNRLLTKDDILDAVWGKLCVTEGLVKEYIHDLRQALGDDPKQPRYIETVHGRGYRYLGGIEVSNGSVAVGMQSEHAGPLPSLAVLPLTNLSSDPEQEYFSDGITEDIITELSRFSGLLVIARNSSFAYKSRPVDIKQVARELGVGYVMEGSVQRYGDRLRITAQLIEAGSGGHIWGEKYDRNLGDIFDLQDEITRHVVGSIAPQVELAELERGRELSETNLSAYEIALKAQALTYDAVRVADPKMLDQAMSLADYRRALELNPNLALNLFTMAWSEAVAGLSADAREHAQLALKLSPRDTDIWLGWAYATLELASFIEGDYSEALKWGRLAIQMHARMPVRQVVMVAGYGYLDDLGAARSHVQALDSFAPEFLTAVPSGNIEVCKLPEHNALLLEGLHSAGM